jgi:hypothetical protein
MVIENQNAPDFLTRPIYWPHPDCPFDNKNLSSLATLLSRRRNVRRRIELIVSAGPNELWCRQRRSAILRAFPFHASPYGG